MSNQSTVIHVGSQENVRDSETLLIPPTKEKQTRESTLTDVEATERTREISDVNKNDCIAPEQLTKEKLNDFDKNETLQNGGKQDDWTKPFKRRSSIENFGRFGLLTPALILVPQIDGNDALTQRFPDLQGENRELILAAAHIDDAINGRGRYGKARAIFKPRKAQTCFAILDSRWFNKIVLIAIIIHTCLIFFEPPPVNGTSPAVFALTAVCLLVYLLDVLLYITFLTWPVFWSIAENRWMRVEFVFLCMFTVDFIFLIIQESIQMRLAQPFRCLRAALLLCKLNNVGHIYDVVLSIAVKMATIFFIITLFIILYAAIGLHLFVMDYHYIGCNNTGLVNCTEDADNIYTGAFDHVGIASLRLFVLLTTENYPAFILPGYAKSAYSFFYFGIFIYVGVFILLAIMLAVIVDGYWVFAKKHVKLERSRERAELAKAWNLLDPLGAGILERSDPKFLTLFRLLRPKNTDDMNQQLIDYLDGNDDGHIDSFEWTTRLNETLSFEFEEDEMHLQRTFPRCFQVIRDGAHQLINSRVFSIAILILIIVHSVLFCVRWWGMSYMQELIIQAIRTVIVSIFVFEIILRMMGEGRGMLQILEILDLALVIIAFVANLVWYVFIDNTIHRGACVVTSSLAVALRMGFNSAQTKRLVSLLMKIFPVMFDLTVLVVIIFYFFSVVGWELFYGSAPDPTFETDYYQYNCGLGFQSFPCSVLVIFQVMTTSNWHEIMNAAMLSTSEWACLYFITCFFVMELMVMNIFVAIAIEAFNKLGSEKEMEQMIQGDDVSTEDKGTLASTAKNFISDMFESSRNEPERKHVAARRGSHISAISTLHISEKGSSVSLRPEEGKDDFSDLPAQLRREKMLKQKMAQRKKKHAKSAMTKIIVMTAFKADRENEIDLNVGEEVNVMEKRNDWLLGSVGEKTGWLPASHVREMKRTHSVEESGHSGSASPKPAWNRKSSEKTDQKTQESKGDKKGGDHTSFHNAALAAAATTHLQVQQQASSQQPKLKIKKRETDWRKSILGDITVMNPEEVRELNKIMKSELKYRGRMVAGESSGSLPGTMKFASTLDGSIQEEDREAEAARLNLTAPGQIRSEKVPSISLDKVDEGQGESGKENSGRKESGEMPSWMMKFAETHNISVTEDVKMEKPSEENEEQSLPGKTNIQTTEL